MRTHLFRKMFFYLLPTANMRSKYIIRHKKLFGHIGKNVFWQSRYFPHNPKNIYLGDNVVVTSGVKFINHDIIHLMLNRMKLGFDFFEEIKDIKVGNNVFLGANSLLLPNVCLGDNVIIGAGSIVTKDIPANSIAAGNPCKVVGDFDMFVAKRKSLIG